MRFDLNWWNVSVYPLDSTIDFFCIIGCYHSDSDCLSCGLHTQM